MIKIGMGSQPDYDLNHSSRFPKDREHGFADSGCETCKRRKYKDGSDENVSFKSAAHIPLQASGAAVRAHEGEHVTNAYLKAREEGGRVLSVGVSIHTAVCPECGRVYIAGGRTRSVISVPNGNPYASNRSSIDEILNTGARADKAV